MKSFTETRLYFEKIQDNFWDLFHIHIPMPYLLHKHLWYLPKYVDFVPQRLSLLITVHGKFRLMTFASPLCNAFNMIVILSYLCFTHYTYNIHNKYNFQYNYSVSSFHSTKLFKATFSILNKTCFIGLCNNDLWNFYLKENSC